MKNLTLLALTILIATSCNRTVVPETVEVDDTIEVQNSNLNKEMTNPNGNVVLIGAVNEDGLKTDPYSKWYAKGADYNTNSEVIAELAKSIGDYEIKAFFGSWCGDSKREIPIMYKVLQEAKYPMQKMDVIAVNNTQDMYKLSPGGEADGLNIHRVPTFIIYKNGSEVGRIVESPVKTVEQDMLDIVSGNDYEANYSIANNLGMWIEANGINQVLDNFDQAIAQMDGKTKSRSELNTLANMYLFKNKEEGLAILKINRALYPNDDYTLDKLAQGYMKFEKYKEAKEMINAVLADNPNHEMATSLLKRVNYFLEN